MLKIGVKLPENIDIHAIGSKQIFDQILGREKMKSLSYVDPYTHEPLFAEESKLVGKNNNIYPIKNGIVDFSGVHEEEFVKMIREGNWIEKAWDFRVKEYNETDLIQENVKQIIKAYNELKAPVVEIACGPGGGFVPAVLIAEPRINILMTDIVFGVVDEWKRFFLDTDYSSNIQFAACDARYLPLSNNSVAAVSSIGIGNVDDIKSVFSEVYRVLKPGGFFKVEDEVLTENTKKMMPNELSEWYAKWCEKRGQINGRFVEILQHLGFSRVDKTFVGTYKLDPDESTLSKKAWEYGVRLEFDQYHINVNK